MTVTDAETIILNVCVFVLIVLCVYLLKYEYIEFKHAKRMHEIEQEAIEQLRRYRESEDHERK